MRALGFLLLVTFPLGTPARAQAASQAQPTGPARPTAAPQAAAPTAAQPGSATGFDAAAARARSAREAGRDAEAIAAYREALALRPTWDEGAWYVGALLYESGRWADADAAFARFLELKPSAGPGWVLRGLCAFDAGDYASAAQRLQRGLALGLGGNVELESTARLRLALSFVKTYEYERALAPLKLVARSAPDKPEVITAVGLTLLRMPLLPSEVPEARRDLVQKTGRAGALHLAERGAEAEKAYAELVAAYPNEPWVHYAQGVFLLRSDSERGLAALRRELEVSPTNVLAALEIAFELLRLNRNEEAKAAAERAVELSPTLFATHTALGRALVETGDVERGIGELLAAVRLAPESPEVHFALARAYARAGRDEDASRERNEFTRLDRQRSAAGGGQP